MQLVRPPLADVNAQSRWAIAASARSIRRANFGRTTAQAKPQGDRKISGRMSGSVSGFGGYPTWTSGVESMAWMPDVGYIRVFTAGERFWEVRRRDCKALTRLPDFRRKRAIRSFALEAALRRMYSSRTDEYAHRRHLSTRTDEHWRHRSG